MEDQFPRWGCFVLGFPIALEIAAKGESMDSPKGALTQGTMICRLPPSHISSLQCLRQLYLGCYSSRLAHPVDASQQMLFDTDAAVGKLTRQRFPRGRLIEETERGICFITRSVLVLLSGV